MASAHSHSNCISSRSSLLIINYIQLSDAHPTHSSTLTPHPIQSIPIFVVHHMPGNILTRPCRFVFARYSALHLHAHMDPPPHLRGPMLVFSAHLRGRTPVFSAHLCRPMLVFSSHTKVISSVRREARWLRAERGPLAPRGERPFGSAHFSSSIVGFEWP